MQNNKEKKNVFEIENLSFAYDKHEVLNNLNLSFHEGIVTTMIGPNGCGKSTLLQLMTKNLKPAGGKILLQGEDGFFVDNCDVYDYAHKKDIFDGLTVILKKIRAMGKPVVVNGGDIYVTAYQSRYGSAADIMTGVNQESVWSRIDFTTKTFHTQKKTEREYFCQYLQACKADGMDVYLLEYTTDHKLIRRIKKYCRKKKYDYYIADSLELGI